MTTETEQTNREMSSARKISRGLVTFLFWSVKILLIYAVTIVVLNSVDNFLHAPIGIKDNPPEPGPAVEFGQLLLWPLVAGYFCLRLLRWCLDQYTLLEITFATLMFGSFGLVGLWDIQKVFHFDLFPGSRELVRLVLPFPIAILLLAWNLFISWGFVYEWNGKGSKFRAGIVLISGSSIPAVISFAELCVGNRTQFCEYAILSAVLHYMGIGLIPSVKKVQRDIHETSPTHVEGID